MQRVLTFFVPVLVLLLINLTAETGRSDQALQPTAPQAPPSNRGSSEATENTPDLKVAENVRRLEEDLAGCRLFRAHLELSRLVQKYPHTKAGQRARQLLEGGGMHIIDFPMKTSDHYYYKGVPIYRYSCGFYISTPEDVIEGIRFF
ncbi:hypothetical protein [Gimesia sp.]|uniref:hypothetical protein n=1 Tax=Gimesia sp. TaxID=2024833 RepID=UPI003A95526E